MGLLPKTFLAGELRDQRPGGVPMNEERFALGALEVALALPDNEGKGGRPKVGSCGRPRASTSARHPSPRMQE
jgi:hypothetical protein